jgi:class 3 adenylate cyclase
MSCSAIGDTINLAARLQAVARPGELVIGPTTLEASTIAQRWSRWEPRS